MSIEFQKSLPTYRKAIRGKVTKGMIDWAIKENSSHCMIAEAIKTADPTLRHVSVDISTIRFSDPEKEARFVYLTPEIIRRKLIRFDLGADVAPFDFLLRCPAHVVPIRHASPAVIRRIKERKKERAEETKKTKLVRGHGAGEHELTRLGGSLPQLAALGKTRKFGLRVTTGGKKVKIQKDAGDGSLE